MPGKKEKQSLEHQDVIPREEKDKEFPQLEIRASSRCLPIARGEERSDGRVQRVLLLVSSSIAVRVLLLLL